MARSFVFTALLLAVSSAASAATVEVRIEQTGIAVGSFSQDFPDIQSYSLGNDFAFFGTRFSLGEAMGAIESVAETVSGGCAASDFDGFTAGSIAVFNPTTSVCYYSDVVINAANAGAVGAIMLTSLDSVSGVSAGFAAQVSIPAVVVSAPLGSSLLAAVAVPIPAAVWLFGSALAGLGWLRRKQTV
jgi:hypothetical protein